MKGKESDVPQLSPRRGKAVRVRHRSRGNRRLAWPERREGHLSLRADELSAFDPVKGLLKKATTDK